ncbi:unnamed protein product [Diamesa tonsa]
MSTRREIVSWEEISSIINADDSEIDDMDDDENNEEIFWNQVSPPEFEIVQHIFKSGVGLIELIMEDERCETECGAANDVEKENEFPEYGEIEEEFLNTTTTFNVTEKAYIQWRKREFMAKPIEFNGSYDIPINQRTPYEIFTEYISSTLITNMALYSNMYTL